ncbi:MAG: hypothetical protein ACP5QA_07585 [Phycisphaerae bacterium]
MAKQATHLKFALTACVSIATALAAGLYGSSAIAAPHHRKKAIAPAKVIPANGARRLHTGSVLTNVPGKLILSGKGRYPDFEFTKPQKLWPHSVKLLPCLTLQAMEALHEPHARFVISGLLTRYHHTFYLLPDADVRLLRKHAPHAIATPPAHATEPKTAVKGPENSAQAVMRNLLSHHISRPVQPIQPMLTVRPIPYLPQPIGNLQSPALREGSYIWNRPGRLMFNDPLHEWIFVFQSDGQGLGEPPLIMLPSSLLQRMQTRSAQRGTEIKFRVSGKITQFKGRNYLFPTYVEVAHNLGRF